MIQPRVAESFARQGIMTTVGAELVHADAGVCRTAAPVPGFTQQHGHGHAGLTFALGDTGAGHAALSVMPDTRFWPRGRVLKSGGRLVVAAAEVRAVLQGTMIPV